MADRGYLTTISELEFIKAQSDTGVEPYATNVSDFTSHAGAAATWTHGTLSGTPAGATEDFYTAAGVATSTSQDPVTDVFVEYPNGGATIYQKALAGHLLGDTAYFDTAIDKIEQLSRSTWTDTTYNGATQAILHAATSIPLWIQAADLMTDYSGFTTAKQEAFKDFLAAQIFPKVSWASHARKNNWGSAGSLCSWMIADYVDGYIANLTDTEDSVPNQTSVTPAAAKVIHFDLQKDRMGTSVQMDESTCAIWGIQNNGAIPSETRRGAGGAGGNVGCNSTSLLDDLEAVDTTARTYQIKHLQHLIFHAECMRRRGGEGLYNFRTPNGSYAIRQAIRFVIHNPTDLSDSTDWIGSARPVLYVAHSRYKDKFMKDEADLYTSTKGGGELPYGRFTHGYGVSPSVTKVIGGGIMPGAKSTISSIIS